MSQAHRPTWNPTQGRETKAGSQQISKLSLASHTKLKFRQPGQTSTSDVARRDLKAELIAAERAANERKRKAAGLALLPEAESERENVLLIEGEDDEARKRRKVLEEVAGLDRDDSDGEEEGGEGKGKGKGKGKADEEDEDDAEDDDDE
jgi:protein CWC15